MVIESVSRRESDAKRTPLARLRDLWLRDRRRQSQFSLFSAALSGVLLLTMFVDYLVGHEDIQRGVVALWLASFAVMTVLPLMLGRSYPRWAGLLFVAYLTFWSGYNLINTVHPHMEVNALLESPMVAVYLGWFYRPLIARAGMAIHLGALTAIVLLRTTVESHQFSSDLAITYTVLISVFCLEAASYVHRVADREAQHDQLTGALNRHGLSKFSARAFARARRSAEPVILAVVDFDDFKAVNDDGGHAEGDRALREATFAWTAGLGKRDLVARTGGDEFVLIIHAELATAHQLLEKLSGDAEHPWSWGLAQYSAGDTLYSLMLRADRALYAQKGSIRG